jgi:glycosyltransferase involved in cell wall biosynthesis
MTMGAAADRIFVAINTVDTDFFRTRTAELSAISASPDAPARFLYVGYLNRRKNVAAVLDAVALLAARRRDFVLDVVGDGDQRTELEVLAQKLGIGAHVRFHGYRQKEELPAFYAHCRGLLFQTDFDIWGLVLVEGMAAGVPCLASPNAGATRDLIKDGVTGYEVDFADPQRVALLMETLIDNPVVARDVGRAASELIRDHVSLATSATGIVAAVRAADRANLA